MTKKKLFKERMPRKQRTETPATGTTVTVTEPAPTTAPTDTPGRRGRPSIPTSFTLIDGPANAFVVNDTTYEVGITVNITRAQILSVAYKAIAAGFAVNLGPVNDS